MGEGYIPLYKTFRQNGGGKPGEARTENRLILLILNPAHSLPH
jgi:hypothetical protein